MPLICECIVVTANKDGVAHLAPLGLIAEGERWILAPFRPSKTLENLIARPFAIANHTDDARVYAGCLTGRRSWPLSPTHAEYPPRLTDALAHWELAVEEVREDALRPSFVCRVRARQAHAPYSGHNRAFAAVVEAAVLASRLHMLPRGEIASGFSRIKTIVDKTAGPREAEAFSWLEAMVAESGTDKM